MKLSDRKKKILQYVIDDYISTAQPVSSKSITEKYMKDISSATVRSELAGLEEMGYLTQLHTSSGRVPSIDAYRLYVNDLMDSQVVSETIINHVYGEGDTPTMDPLNSERTLSESETGDLVTALNNKWQGATAEEKADPNFNKGLVAMAALVNVSVTITDQGVVAA